MGMYNTVLHTCPNCGSTVENQTKSGSCTLATFSEDSVPPEELSGLDSEVTCCSCGNEYKVVRPQVINIQLRLEEI